MRVHLLYIAYYYWGRYDRSKLQINYKLSNVVIYNSSFKINASFLLVKNITSKIILGSPFIQRIMPFLVMDKGIVIENLQKIFFPIYLEK